MAVYQNSLLDMERFKAAMRKPVADKKLNALSKVGSCEGSNTSHTITNASSKLLFGNSHPASNTSLINSPRGLMLKKLDEMMGRDGALGGNWLKENQRLKEKVKKMSKLEEDPTDYLILLEELKNTRSKDINKHTLDGKKNFIKKNIW